MDKGEKGKRSSPKSASHRTYGLFSNIINLSSPSVVRSGSSQESPVDSSTATSKLLDVSTTKKKEKKIRGNQSPSSCSSISSSGAGGITVPAPIGPAPKTFSILTALNELAISDQGTHNPKPYRKSPLLPDPPGSSISSENSTSTNNSTGTFQHSLHEVVKPGNRLGRGWRKATYSTSVQKSGESEIATRNERSKSKERTPEWIWKLFQLAKHGKLQELQRSLKGLDSTLIRHLADATGSTLLHCAARGGHLSTLQWLVSILGPNTEAAVNDRNRTGRSVILTALKEGQLDCFQWLVLNTRTGGTALVPNDGERSLLHYAASYSNLAAVRWLLHILHERGFQVDLRDSSGRTPLHMSAKAGSISVCHELILAGSDPLCQTELGWKPADMAIRHRRMECVNYFMMAETAASVGNELHLLLKEFEADQQERESLRSHFRELLRVGKWLVKERTDLIKNFRFKSTTEGSILLGEVNEGTRFSELEHKLVQAEQAWKHLYMRPKSDVGGTSENGKSYHFQRSLLATQSRCDMSIAVNASSSSDEEDSCPSEDSNNVLDNLKTYPLTNNTCDPDPYYPIPQRLKSSIAPWLLPPNDAFLSQLAPFVSQLDLLGNAPSAQSPFSNQPSNSPNGPRNTVETVGDQSFLSSPSTFYETAHQVDSSSNVEATVLEVIEPTSLPIKGVHLTPDLIRATKCGSTAENVDGQWLECQGGPRSDETIYSEIKASSHSSSTSIKSYTPCSELPQPVLYQTHKTHRFPPTKMGQTHGETFLSSNLNDLDQHLVCFQFFNQENPSKEDLSKSFPNTTQPVSNLVTSESIVLTNVAFSSSQSRRTHTSKLTVLPISDSSSKMIFPILTSIEFSPQQLESTESHEEISCGPLSQIPPESVSTSNTPVMRRSDSTMSRSSSTVLFPSRKGSLVSPEFLSSMTTESSLTGRLSPSPSEASRTESALAPPPSNASHASHNSETSKTESARGIVRDRTRNEPDQDFGESGTTGNECSSPESEDLGGGRKEVEETLTKTFNPVEINRKHRENDENDESKISSLGTFPTPNPAPCVSMRPQVSSEIHKATIQRVTKSGRGQPKPWYEIEGSDDEGSLLRKARSQSSRSSKLSTSSLSNSESENESETSDEHECDPSCPRHNCPDFV